MRSNEITVDGIKVRIERSQRKTSSIYVYEDDVVFKTNYFVQDEDIKKFVLEKKSWILKKLSNQKKNVIFEWKEGKRVYILGREYYLRLVTRSSSGVETIGNDLYVYGRTLSGQKKAFVQYLGDILDNYIDYYRNQLTYKPGDYTLYYRFYRSRWGCCNKTRREIGMNLWCACMAPEAIKYVFCHELAHLKVANHQKEFYSELARIYPDYKKGLKLSKEYMIH